MLALKRTAPSEPIQDSNGVLIHPTSALAELLPRTTHLLLCCPLTDATRGMIGAAELTLLPPAAVVVNIGRAEVVDEVALWDALNDSQKKLAFAADVWWNEPGPPGAKSDEHEQPLLWPSRFPMHEHPNVVL
eukprot:SAG31_NODE_212_length_20157_cov_9.648868_23_plen_132_part_00